ncbi:hypothetical protein COOONC_17497 [Cooperia oncophora]
MALNGHNERRSRLARGEMESNGNRTAGNDPNLRRYFYRSLAPPATNMFRMVYNCDAESYAQQHASSCRMLQLPPSGRPGYKTNMYFYRNTQATPTAALLTLEGMAKSYQYLMRAKKVINVAKDE